VLDENTMNRTVNETDLKNRNEHPEQQLLERVGTISFVFVMYPVGIVTHMAFVISVIVKTREYM